MRAKNVFFNFFSNRLFSVTSVTNLVTIIILSFYDVTVNSFSVTFGYIGLRSVTLVTFGYIRLHYYLFNNQIDNSIKSLVTDVTKIWKLHRIFFLFGFLSKNVSKNM